MLQKCFIQYLAPPTICNRSIKDHIKKTYSIFVLFSQPDSWTKRYLIITHHWWRVFGADLCKRLQLPYTNYKKMSTYSRQIRHSVRRGPYSLGKKNQGQLPERHQEVEDYTRCTEISEISVNYQNFR